MLSIDEIVEILEWIEMLLIGSLKRNLAPHKSEEKKYGFGWTAWQAEKLRNVDKFRRENAAIMSRYTDIIDKNTRAILEEQFREGVNGAAQEAGEAPQPTPIYYQPQQAAEPTSDISVQEQPPAQPPTEQPAEQPTESESPQQPTTPEPADEPKGELIAEVKPEPQFFGVDKTKVNKLIEDMTQTEKQAETAALRLTDDVYRQTLNRVQLAMSTGSMTLPKAIDLAVEDFLNAGINCIEYKDGRRVNIADYVRMALRTTSTRAALQGKSEKYKALGYDTVAVSSYGMCSPTCLPYQGRVYINDAFTSWSGETEQRADGLIWGKSNYCGKWFPLLSSAIKGGLFHPNCRHSITLWRDGDKLPETLDNSETEHRYKLEQQQRALEREIRKAKRKVEGFTEPENIAMAQAQLKEKQKQLREFIGKTNAEEGEKVLRRDYEREKVYDDNVNNKSVDNGGESGIIKPDTLKMAASQQKPPDFSKYEVKADLEAVENMRGRISESLGIPLSDIDLDGIQNTEVLEPFVKRLEKIQKDTGMKFPSIRSTSIIDGDETCITGYKRFENTLYISSKYFNSKEATLDTLKDWAKNGIMPKHAKTIAYLAEHEAAHIRIPIADIENEEAFTIFRKAVRKGLCENDKNIYEFFADCSATDRTGNHESKMQEAIDYLNRRGGIGNDFSKNGQM